MRKYYYIDTVADKPIMEAIEGRVVVIKPELTAVTLEVNDWEFMRQTAQGSIFWYYSPNADTAIGVDDIGQQWSASWHKNLDGEFIKCIEFSSDGMTWEVHPLSHDYQFEETVDILEAEI